MTHTKDRAIKKELGKLKRWVHGNLMWFNRTKCCCCTWVRANTGINSGWG